MEGAATRTDSGSGRGRDARGGVDAGGDRDAAFPSYMPIMSFVGGKSYIHGFENRRADTAKMPRDLAAVMPGEGV